MRKEIPILADIYPAGEYVCNRCGEQNLPGESFYLEHTLTSTKHLCPDCNEAIKKKEKEEQAELYAAGEEEPSYTDEITCPWCGYEHADSWEYADSDNECECMNCNKMFGYERHIEVTYSSSRVENK